MTWNFFAIVDASDDNPALFPVLSAPNSNLAVELDQSDGRAPLLLHATAARVLGTNASGQLAAVMPLPSDVKWDVVITDSRVIVYCEKYDKGGGWVGFGGAGIAFALAANAVSKARAAHRRKGKVLVAHVRYPWLERLLAAPKTGWLSSERLRLRVNSAPGGPNRFIMLELDLPKHESALGAGCEIARRCARYRLANDPTMEPQERERFMALATGRPRNPEPPAAGQKTGWATYTMPSNYRVNATTAVPKPAAPPAQQPAVPPQAAAADPAIGAS